MPTAIHYLSIGVLELINEEGQLTPLKPGAKLKVKEGMKFFEQVPCGGSS
jgi:hypothetical protein